jgi:hypothetical protein
MLLNYATPIDCKSDVVWQHKREEAEASPTPHFRTLVQGL